MIKSPKILPAAGIIVLAATSGAFASSTDAGHDLTDKLDTACIEASDLKAAKIIWTNPYFDHQMAAIVDGVSPQKQMEGKRASVLCLYDEKTGRAEVQHSMLNY
ncbi:MAG: hypothetical protein ABWY00_10635 [Dongiaceae bacterium]